MLDGSLRQVFLSPNFRREWPLKFTGLTNTQWNTNILAFLESTSQLYFQGPQMSAKVAVICESYKAIPAPWFGDSAATPHWEVTLTLREQVP